MDRLYAQNRSAVNQPTKRGSNRRNTTLERGKAGAASVAEVEQIHEAQRAADWATSGARARAEISVNMRQHRELE